MSSAPPIRIHLALCFENLPDKLGGAGVGTGNLAEGLVAC